MTDAPIRAAARIIAAAVASPPATVRSFFDPDTFTVTHVVSDPASAAAF